MSSKISVDDIEKASQAYDNKTHQFVSLVEQISDTFYVCESHNTEEYILCHIDNLSDYYYWG